MGQCIYVREPESPQDETTTREMPSEVWMNPAEAGRTLAADHHVNTTLGIWLYESDLWDKALLRERLMRLVDHVCAPDFKREYEEHGRPQVERLRALGKWPPRRDLPRR